jgi:hypothetical protein
MSLAFGTHSKFEIDLLVGPAPLDVVAGFREVTHRRQILPQQILRHLYGIDDYAIRIHEAKQARRTLTFWVVRTA